MGITDPKSSREPSGQVGMWERVTKGDWKYAGRQADLDWSELEKRTLLYKVFGKEAVLGARFIPPRFPGNLLQDPQAKEWTWCDGFVGAYATCGK